MNSLFTGVYWFMKSISLLGEINTLAGDIREVAEKDRPCLSDYVKVACQIGTVVCDIYVLKKDWDTSALESKIKIDKDDIQRIQQELNKNKVTAAKFQAMALGTHMLHNKIEGGYLIDEYTIARMVSFARRNSQISSDQQMLGTVNSLSLLMAGVEISGYALSHFDDWYETHGANAPRISLLIDYEDIPDDHHQNPVFNQFICPITLNPIRYPVTAPNAQGGPDHHFERKAILNWLRINRTNPVNRAPLRIHELRENLHMRQQIEAEMAKLELL